MLLFMLLSHVFSVRAQVVPPDSLRNNIQKAIEKMVNDPALKNASVSFMAIDHKSKKELAYYNPDQSLVPASVMKTVTTATALEVMGPGYTFKTVLAHTGYVDSNCVLHGDIYIVGGGDPALGSRFFSDHYFQPDFMHVWSDAVIQLGIDSIDGRIIGDDLLFGIEPTPSTWTYGDLGNYYGASPSGLSIYDNQCTLSFSTGEVGDSARLECIDPFVPNLEFLNEVTGGNVFRDHSTITGALFDEDRIITGSLPKGKDNYEVRGSLPDPGLQTAFELNMALHSKGVFVNGGYTTTRKERLAHRTDTSQRTEFYTQTSPSLSSIAYWTNLVSVNLFAEHLMCQIGLVKTGNGQVEYGTSYTTSFWSRKGINTDGMYLMDGSGLSRYNGISARHLSGILLYMATRSRYGDTFRNTLPVSGKSGTMRTVCDGTVAAGRVYAKSGTIQRVKAYAGYVHARSGTKMSFAILVNNFNCSSAELIKKIEKVMVAMSLYVN